jgi:uncharacterized protein YpmS
MDEEKLYELGTRIKAFLEEFGTDAYSYYLHIDMPWNDFLSFKENFHNNVTPVSIYITHGPWVDQNGKVDRNGWSIFIQTYPPLLEED